MTKADRAAVQLAQTLVAQGKEVYYILVTDPDFGVSEVLKVYARDAYQANLYALETFEGYTVQLLGEENDPTE